MSHDKKSVKAGRPAFFKDPEVDRLLAIIVRLMTEHSVLDERVKALESLLIDSGALSEDACNKLSRANRKTTSGRKLGYN